MLLPFQKALSALVIGLTVLPVIGLAQAPSAVQIFMPNGDRPPRELRFTLTRDDGRIDILFTDSKGKFQLTGDLNRDREYTITIEGDERTFATTTASLRLLRGSVSYLPIFLRPYKGKSRNAPGVVEVGMPDVPPAARDRYEKGLKLINEGQADSAISELKAAISIYPNYLYALNDLGVLYLKLNRLTEAAETLQNAVKIDKRLHVTRLNLGIVMNRQHRFAEAADTLASLHKENPTMSGLSLPFADALIGSNRLSEAGDLLRKAISSASQDKTVQVEAHYKLGVVLSREERYADAVGQLEKAISLDPTAANPHLLLGAAFLQLKRYGGAERHLRLAYQLGGQEMGNAQLFLGQLYLTQQNYAAALTAFKQFMKDMPNAPNASQVQATIERIKEALSKK